MEDACSLTETVSFNEIWPEARASNIRSSVITFVTLAGALSSSAACSNSTVPVDASINRAQGASTWKEVSVWVFEEVDSSRARTGNDQEKRMRRKHNKEKIRKKDFRKRKFDITWLLKSITTVYGKCLKICISLLPFLIELLKISVQRKRKIKKKAVIPDKKNRPSTER